ncbi:hypothetical protein JCM3770_002350 [Rhodotorula araucariae]
MPCRLPDEVVLLIFAAVAEPVCTPNEYKRRQDTLCCLSLLASRYRDLAQALLWAVVYARERGHLDRFRRIKDIDGPRTGTKVFHVSTKTAGRGTEGPVLPDEVVEVATLFPDVEEIHIECARSTLDMHPLGGHAGLIRLSLVNVDLSASSPVLLPRLEQLRLDRAVIPSSLLTAWLDPVHLPSLAAVRLGTLYDTVHGGAPRLDLSRAFLAQVDFIQTPSLSLDTLQRFHASTAPPFLFSSSLRTLVPLHLVLAAHQFDGRARATTTLERFGAQVGASAPVPVPVPVVEGPGRQQARVVVLPRCLEALAAADTVVGAALGAFVATCGRRGARVLWYDGGDGELVSHEFWRYARDLKGASGGGRLLGHR